MDRGVWRATDHGVTESQGQQGTPIMFWPHRLTEGSWGSQNTPCNCCCIQTISSPKVIFNDFHFSNLIYGLSFIKLTENLQSEIKKEVNKWLTLYLLIFLLLLESIETMKSGQEKLKDRSPKRLYLEVRITCEKFTYNILVKDKPLGKCPFEPHEGIGRTMIKEYPPVHWWLI